MLRQYTKQTRYPVYYFVDRLLIIKTTSFKNKQRNENYNS